MDDELQRRLRAADPLTAGDGLTRTPAQLEKLKEFALMETKRHTAATPRLVGTAALTALALAGVFLVGSLTGAPSALAFSAQSTMPTPAQLEAVDAACTAPIDGAAGFDLELKSLELFGNGGVAIYGNESIIGYCMVLVDGYSAQAGARILGLNVEGTEFIEAAGSTEFEGQTLSIIVGNAPVGATKVEIVGLDGVYATVLDGRYGLWLPQSFADEAFEVVARDANGDELQRAVLPWGKTDGGTGPVQSEEPAPTR
ncbi:MAG: hypothetical protein ACKOC3_01210 [Candidatus Limnocylindrus sp.]